MTDNNKVLLKFLRKLHNSQNTGKLAVEIAQDLNLPEKQYDFLIARSWLQPTDFCTSDYKVADPIVARLGLKPYT